MVSVARDAPGLLYRSDGSLSGWSGPGQWSSVADPTMVAFDSLPGHLFVSAGGVEVDGVREAQLYVESGTWWLYYDAGDHVHGWETSVASSTDLGLTWTRHGATSEGYQRADGNTVSAYAAGFMEKRGSAYYRHRVCCDGVEGPPNTGLCGGTPTGDSWSGTSTLGPWTGTSTMPLQSGTWLDLFAYPCSVYFDGTTYHMFAGGLDGNGGNVGRMTGTSPGGPWTRHDPLILNPTVSGTQNHACENADVFFHPGLDRFLMLANAYPVDGTPPGCDLSMLAVSSSVSDWSGLKVRAVQRASIAHGGPFIGVPRRVTGPDGSLIYDAASGIVPITWDTDPERFSPGWHLGRKIRMGALEPSAKAIRYAGSADTTARRISRTLSHQDIVIEFAVELTAVNASGGSIAVEYRGDGSGISGFLATLTVGAGLRLAKLSNGTPSSVGSPTGSQVAAVADGLHTVRISAVGNAHTLSLDGETQVTYTDPTPPTSVSGRSRRGRWFGLRQSGSGLSVNVVGKGVDADVRCFSARSSSGITIVGMSPGDTAAIRGYGDFPAGTATANGSGVATFTNPHYPLYSVGIGGSDFPISGGLWGGDLLSVSGG